MQSGWLSFESKKKMQNELSNVQKCSLQRSYCAAMFILRWRNIEGTQKQRGQTRATRMRHENLMLQKSIVDTKSSIANIVQAFHCFDNNWQINYSSSNVWLWSINTISYTASCNKVWKKCICYRCSFVIVNAEGLKLGKLTIQVMGIFIEIK